MQFTEDVIAELAALAPGNYIHIGGDEAIGLPHDKFVRFINKTREIVIEEWKENGRLARNRPCGYLGRRCHPALDLSEAKKRRTLLKEKE